MATERCGGLRTWVYIRPDGGAITTVDAYHRGQADEKYRAMFPTLWDSVVVYEVDYAF